MYFISRYSVIAFVSNDKKRLEKCWLLLCTVCGRLIAGIVGNKWWELNNWATNGVPYLCCPCRMYCCYSSLLPSIQFIVLVLYVHRYLFFFIFLLKSFFDRLLDLWFRISQFRYQLRNTNWNSSTTLTSLIPTSVVIGLYCSARRIAGSQSFKQKPQIDDIGCSWFMCKFYASP